MCSPAPVVLHEAELTRRESELAVRAPTRKAGRPNSLRHKLQNWLMGWKQTLIAELASLGSAKEGFS